MKRSIPVAALLLTGIVAAGCAKPRPAPKVFVPPPPVVRTMPLPQLIVPDPPPSPGLYLRVEAIPYPFFGPTFELPERPGRTQPPRTRPTAPGATATPAETAEPAPPPVSVPKLTQILSDEDAKRYRGELDEAAREAERVLESASRRSLTATQVTLVQQVRSFLKQAQEQRDADLVTARNLARRAAILARDLQSSFR